MDEWVVWFNVEPFTLHLVLKKGLTPIVSHCSDSGPCLCPGTGHSQCDYTIKGSMSYAKKDLYWHTFLLVNLSVPCLQQVCGHFLNSTH